VDIILHALLHNLSYHHESVNDETSS